MAQEQQAVATKPRARFSHTPDPVRQTVSSAAATHSARRTGIIALCIGAARVLRGRDGAKRIYTARELDVERDRARRDKRELTVGLVCFECGRTYATVEEFKDDHQLPEAKYKEVGECHTWAYWCEDKYDPKSLETIAACDEEVKALEKSAKSAQNRLIEAIGKGDGDAIMAARKSVEEIKVLLDGAERRKRAEEENIIGLLSETPFPA